MKPYDIDNFLQRLQQNPLDIEFQDTIALIDALYDFTPSAFDNGDISNEANENNGSCKIFAFSQLHNLSEELTLACFGHFYRDDVLARPDEDNHLNIRNFMRYGWQGIRFHSEPLREKELLSQ